MADEVPTYNGPGVLLYDPRRLLHSPQDVERALQEAYDAVYEKFQVIVPPMEHPAELVLVYYHPTRQRTRQGRYLLPTLETDYPLCAYLAQHRLAGSGLGYMETPHRSSGGRPTWRPLFTTCGLVSASMLRRIGLLTGPVTDEWMRGLIALAKLAIAADNAEREDG